MARPLSPRRHGWRTADLVRAAAVAVTVYYAARFLYFAHVLIFLAFLGVLFGLAVSAGADLLQRVRIPRTIGVIIIVVGFLALLVGFGTWTGPTIRRQFQELRVRLPEAFGKADQWVARREAGVFGPLLTAPRTPPAPPRVTIPGGPAAPTAPITTPDTTPITPPTTAYTAALPLAPSPGTHADSLSHLHNLTDRLLGPISSGAKQFFFPVIMSTFAAVSGIILVLFLTIYIAVDPLLYRRGLLALIPRPRRARYDQVITAASQALRRWLVTQLIAMLAIGTVTTGILFLLDVRAALPLGIIAGLLEFVPTIGPTLSAVPAIAMGFVDSPEKAAIVTVAYVGIQFLENHLLIPLLMKEGVGLPPVLTILTQAVMALLFGFVGLFVAVPLLVLATIIVNMLYIEDILGQTTSLPFTEEPTPAPQ